MTKSSRASGYKDAAQTAAAVLDRISWSENSTTMLPALELLVSHAQAMKSAHPHADESYQLLEQGLCETVARAFRHHVASRANTAALDTLYVFPNKTAQETPDECFQRESPFVVNNNENDLDAYLEYLSSKAKDFNHAGDHHLTDRLNRTIGRFFLTGPRGCGKTFFLNYMMTVKREMLDDKGICCVRISMTRPLSGWSLADRIFLQTIRIIRKYYLPERGTSEHDEFADYLRTIAGHELGVHGLIEAIESVPNPKPERFAVDPTDVDSLTETLKRPDHLEYLFDVLSKYLQIQGYTFLFIIDGLDAALPTTACEKWLDEWLSELPSLWQPPNSFPPSLWIICLRSRSLDKLQQDPHYVISNLNRVPILELGAPSVANVIRSRFREAVRSHNANKVLTTPVLNSQTTYNLCLLFEYFVCTGLGLLSPRGESTHARQHEDATDLLEMPLSELFEGNYRKLMTILELCVARLFYSLGGMHREFRDSRELKNESDFLIAEKLAYLPMPTRENWHAEPPAGKYLGLKKSELPDAARLVAGRAHEVMSVFMHGKHLTHRLPFSYKRGKKKMTIEKISSFDHRCSFFPNVFNFSQDLASVWDASSKSDEDIINFLPFMQLYILFLLRHHSGMLTKLQILKLVERIIGDEQIVAAALTNMLFYGLVRKSREYDGVAYYMVGSAGDYLWNTLLRNSAYVVDITETTPVRRSFLLTISDDFQRAIVTNTPRGERYIIRIRLAYLHLRYLRSLWDGISDESKDEIPEEFIDALGGLFDGMHKALLDLLEYMAKPLIDRTTETGMANAYSKYLLGQRGAREALETLGHL